MCFVLQFMWIDKFVFGVALRFLCCSVMLLCCFVGYGWCGWFCLDRETVGCGWFLLGWQLRSD